MLPERFWKAQFSRIPDDTQGVVERYIRSLGNFLDPGKVMREGYGFIFWGDNDTGKTSAASVILKEARRRGFTSLFIRAPQYRDGVMQGAPFDDDMTLPERCSGVDMLLLDDLGKEPSSKESDGGSQRMFEELLRDRCSNLRPTIITMNSNPYKALEDRYARSFTRLISETFTIIKVGGPSQRELGIERLESFFQE